MDTTRITAPIVDRIPIATNFVSTLADTTTGLAGQIGDHAGQLGDHVGDLDVAGTVRRGRRAIARYVPGVSAPPARSRRWVLIVVAAVTVAGLIVVMRRRSSDDAATSARDDWSTSASTNGASPNASSTREPASTNV